MASKSTFIRSLFIAFFQLLSINALAQGGGADKQTLRVYKEALTLFNRPDPTAHTDSIALNKLLRVTHTVKPDKKNAPIFFDCYEKAGIIKQTYGSQRQAIALYKQAIACRSAYNLPDSLLFKPYLYCGLGYYFSNLFDSSLHYFKKSEAILLKFPAEQEAQRLYNSFGALYYESGNYQQSINYFRKAVQLNLRNKQSNKATMMYGYKSNIATALRKMEQYNAAVSMYKSLIPLRINQNDIFINLGTIYLEKNQPDSALYYLKKVGSTIDYNPIILENALGNAYLQKKSLSDAFLHLTQALTFYKKEQEKSGSKRKSTDIGRTYKLLGDAERQRNRLYAALGNYQRALIQFDYTFNDTTVRHNPPMVAGGFQNYELFGSLAAKASCLAALCKEAPTGKNRSSTISAYESALKLADYIEKSFDTEEAQLFTIRNIFSVYQEAVTFMVHSFEKTKERSYLENAFCWAEKSKAVALYINLKENEIKSSKTIPDSLLKKERALKVNRSLLQIKIDKAMTSQKVAALTSEMQDNELALSRLANKLLDYPDYRRRKFSSDTIDIAYLRKNQLERQSAILSYFQASNEVYCFILTHEGIHYHKFRRDSTYYRALSTINTQLRNLTPGLAYQGHANASFLYKLLIKPAEIYLKKTTSLLIIPHNELGLLPFEILEDETDRYLLEKFDVAYQYAASFIQYGTGKNATGSNTLAMAPFDSINVKRGSGFAELPASDQEIADLKGMKFKNRNATKANFLAFSGQASGIHLATHAVANTDDPSRSYIAFYADKADGGKLYAHELRNTALSNVYLVFLSACETASGKLISGEGIMSLSRAFSLAGCSNVVTSLWKAEDNTTAYISRKFYAYQQQGYSQPQALQRAKLDLLHDGQFAQFHSPQYWSHLVFIGIPDESAVDLNGWYWLGFSTIVILITLALHYKKNRAFVK